MTKLAISTAWPSLQVALHRGAKVRLCFIAESRTHRCGPVKRQSKSFSISRMIMSFIMRNGRMCGWTLLSSW